MNFKQSIESRRARAQTLKLVAAVACTCWGILAADGCGHSAHVAPTSGYTLTLGRDHPLTGRVFAGATQSEVTNEELERALASAQLVLLGETHDNADHHLLQAALLERFAALHPHSAAAFEMLDEAQADELRTIDDQTPDEIAKRVYWTESGWPDFALYRPIFAAAKRAHLALLAASPSADHVRASMAGLSEAELDLLKLSEPLPEAQLHAQAEEIRASHCGHANDAMVTAMQRAQSFKDAFMAEKLLEAGRPVVLIAGRGHVRKDRGVPVFLARRGGKYSLSIAFIDVESDKRALSDYDIRAFDYAVFTPRVSDADPCQKFREQLERMHAQPAM
jgi:uncharacterized iron-regulated protein